MSDQVHKFKVVLYSVQNQCEVVFLTLAMNRWHAEAIALIHHPGCKVVSSEYDHSSEE